MSKAVQAEGHVAVNGQERKKMKPISRGLFVAAQLIQNARDLSNKDRWTGSTENDRFVGALGELLFAEAIPEAKPVIQSELPSKADGTDAGDFILPDGRVIDVKTTHHYHGHLLVTNPGIADLFVLAIVCGRAGRIAGFATKDDLANAVPLPGLKCQSLTQKQLRPIHELKKGNK